jgi:tRNA A37 threonylcarbamoyladenosine dehydratase
MADPAIDDADLERRFSGLSRLYGAGRYARIRAAAVAVVGLGGVGSWAAEALARSGVARLVLIDLDHVSESNINRQIQALSSTVGQAKVLAMAERVREIHPGCEVIAVDDFAGPDNWPALLPVPVDGVIDACDQVRAKATIAAWAGDASVAYVGVGAAGGKLRPQDVETGDLASATHDPLLASLRQRLRRDHGLARTGAMGLRCVFSREPVRGPVGDDCTVDGSLNCHGYGSSVTVTATFGFTAASELLDQLQVGL